MPHLQHNALFLVDFVQACTFGKGALQGDKVPDPPEVEYGLIQIPRISSVTKERRSGKTGKPERACGSGEADLPDAT